MAEAGYFRAHMERRTHLRSISPLSPDVETGCSMERALSDQACDRGSQPPLANNPEHPTGVKIVSHLISTRLEVYPSCGALRYLMVLLIDHFRTACILRASTTWSLSG